MAKYIVALLAALSWFVATPMIAQADQTNVEDRKVWRGGGDLSHRHHHGHHGHHGHHHHRHHHHHHH